MQKKIIVIGSGFGGLSATQALKHTPVAIELIDKSNHHLFQPLLYQVATATLSPGEIATPIREILRKQENCTVFMHEVVKVDKESKTVHFADGTTTLFDYLVVATGASHSYFGNSSWAKHAPGLKTVSDAMSIREQILLSFEKAERATSPLEVKKHLTQVVIGGGPTGVEMAGAICEIARKTLKNNFRKIDPSSAEIYLIEMLPEILPMFPKKLGAYARRSLEKIGVKVLVNTRVEEVVEGALYINGKHLECGNIIWAAGNEASPLIKTLDTPQDRQGRALVEQDLSLPGYPHIFVVGDAACIKDCNLPAIAPTAIQQGRHAAKQIQRDLSDKKRKAFRYFDKGYMATISLGKALAKIGPFSLTGPLAWCAWGFIHIAYLITYRNRLSVMFEWFFLILTGKRSSRIISSNKVD